ncbi:hypothetical protein WISP_145488 [Willisornis vidua]|uniref:Uncharacterized protein n=1 Tax=Willisornis vidua TaxID=1566151 RepID=A0ABQ9CKZ5_9PASS|nr:hypothetical protein WISP_145488 [Willisornis vidua]
MYLKRPGGGLAFCLFYLASCFTNKYVLSVLQFTYPTLFQGVLFLLAAAVCLPLCDTQWTVGILSDVAQSEAKKQHNLRAICSLEFPCKGPIFCVEETNPLSSYAQTTSQVITAILSPFFFAMTANVLTISWSIMCVLESSPCGRGETHFLGRDDDEDDNDDNDYEDDHDNIIMSVIMSEESLLQFSFP